jgi:hypothetical protein
MSLAILIAAAQARESMTTRSWRAQDPTQHPGEAVGTLSFGPHPFTARTRK